MYGTGQRCAEGQLVSTGATVQECYETCSAFADHVAPFFFDQAAASGDCSCSPDACTLIYAAAYTVRLEPLLCVVFYEEVFVHHGR